MEEIKCNQIGKLTGGKWDKLHDMSRRVYGIDGLSPTLHTAGGGNTGPKILIPEPTKKGYDIATYGDSINMAFPNSKTRRGRVGHGVAQTLTTQEAQQAVVEPIIYDDCEAGDTIDAFNKRVNKDGVSLTITTRPEGLKTAVLPVTNDYRIRKLTERECFRLMGVKSEDFEKVRYGAALPQGSSEKIAKRTMTKDEWRVCWRIMRHDRQSVSSCYHLAGDSIVTTCLMAIFGVLLEVDYKQKITELTEELKEK